MFINMVHFSSVSHLLCIPRMNVSNYLETFSGLGWVISLVSRTLLKHEHVNPRGPFQLTIYNLDLQDPSVDRYPSNVRNFRLKLVSSRVGIGYSECL